MAVPKKKKSKSCRNMRRSHDSISAKTSVECSKCGELKLPHHVCKACGTYHDKEIVKKAK